jgi:hypothetical protein
MSERTKISLEALEILRGATCTGDKLHLNCEMLTGDQRPIYDEIKEILLRIGGKWRGGNSSAHIFEYYDPAPLLAALVSSGTMPPKNPTAFFPTPRAVIDILFTMANVNDWRPKMRILEPSAGTGAIVGAILAKGAELAERYGWGDEFDWQVDCCEFLDLNRAVLESKGYHMVGEDFLEYNPGAIYDAVLMNPPFSLPGDAMSWETHIRHAWGLLKPQGDLGAITPSGWPTHQNNRSKSFLDFVCEHGSAEAIDAGAFKDSGTGVSTMALGFVKSDLMRWREKPYNGHLNWHVWAAHVYVGNDREFYNRLQKVRIHHENMEDRAFEIRRIYDECALAAKRESYEPIRLGEGEHEQIRMDCETAWAQESGEAPPVKFETVPAISTGLFAMEAA